MNYFVHAVMYTYYAVRASGHYRPPVWVNMFITLLQLMQMILGVYINIYVCYTMTTDADWYCDGKIETTYMYVYWSFLMYFSYFVLFAFFFYDAYFKKSSSVRSSDGGTSQVKGSSKLLQNGGIGDGGSNFHNSTLGNENTSSNGLHKRMIKTDRHVFEDEGSQAGRSHDENRSYRNRDCTGNVVNGVDTS